MFKLPLVLIVLAILCVVLVLNSHIVIWFATWKLIAAIALIFIICKGIARV